MVRKLTVLAMVLAFALTGCSKSNSKCTGGITFYVAELAGALSRGGTEPLTICFDGTCKDVTITRDEVGGSVFLPFEGVGKDADHDLTVSGTGSLKGQYTGKLASFIQDSGGSSCSLATVKIGADGTLTPAVPAASLTTTTT